MSTLTAFPFIQERSEATPGLWNNPLSIISANIAAVDSTLLAGHFQQLSIGSTPPSYLTTAAVTIEVNSAYSDYLYLVDSSAQKSSYIIGSRAGGLADGLNIWDASAGTMIASFSKQSIRFFQNVVGPVFDVGGALANTLNAATFGTGADSKESRIQAAINQALISSISRVYVPANMYPYSAGSVSFNTNVQMVREGGAWNVHDVLAYGAYGDGIHSDSSSFQAACLAGLAAPGSRHMAVSVVEIPPPPGAGYVWTSTLSLRYGHGLYVRGLGTAGQQNSIPIYWNGVSDGTMLALDRIRDCQFEGFDLQPNLSTIGIAIDMTQMVASIGNGDITSNNIFRRIHIGSSTTGIRIAHGQPGGQNSDLCVFEDCQIIDTGRCGISIEELQSKWHRFVRSTIANRKIGINCAAGSFNAHSVNFSGNSSDVSLGSADDVIVLQACQSESAQRFLEIDSEAGGAWAVNIEDGRLDAGAVASDGSYIIYRNRGPLYLHGNDFASGTSNAKFRVWIANTGNPVVIAQGNIFPSQTPISSSAALGSFVFEGNSWVDGTGAGQPFQNVASPGFQIGAGTALSPGLAVSSETSLGLFRSAASTLALSYGTFAVDLIGSQSGSTVTIRSALVVNKGFDLWGGGNAFLGVAASKDFIETDGTSAYIKASSGVHIQAPGGTDALIVLSPGVIQLPVAGTVANPAINFSDYGVGWYRSGAATISQSSGTFNLALNGVRLSMRTLAASSVTASAANTNVAVNEVVVTVQASGASFAVNSGGTTWIFSSVASAKNT